VDDELARPAAIDTEGVDPVGRRVEPFAEEDAGETDLPERWADANGDLVEALSPTLLDIDIASESGRDRRGEVVAGEFLRTLVKG
jgi:hypothetical protein